MIHETIKNKLIAKFGDEWGNVVPNTPVEELVDYINSLHIQEISFRPQGIDCEPVKKEPII